MQKKLRSNRLSIEALETRIAPAVLFLSGTTNSVVDASGADVNQAAEAATAGSTIAVKLNKGDSLVLDTNGNNQIDAGEVVFAKVTGGSALLFATDTEMTAGFTAAEITGLAVGTGFKAAINGDINGSVVTSIDKTGAYTHGVLQDASIAGLTVSGRVSGSVLAGGSIGNVTINADGAGTGYSVENIATGTAAAGFTESFDGGGNPTGFTYTPTKAGQAGGSISNVKLGFGAEQILAGKGADTDKGTAGKGGSVSKITFLNVAGEFDIYGGDGGKSTGQNGRGGDGGSVSAVNISYSGGSTFNDESHIYGGEGGEGGSGGNGGSVSGAVLNFSADVLAYLYLTGGDGGDATTGLGKGSGGNGGSVLNNKFTSSAKVDFVRFYGGDAGDGGDNTDGKGGNGGTVNKATYFAKGGKYGAYAAGGDGGTGKGKGAGGNGGSAINVDINNDGELDNQGYIWGGDGGDGGNTDAKGGNGGNVLNAKYRATTGAADADIYGGDGGNGSGKGSGGNGGYVKNLTAFVGTSTDTSDFYGGDGGDGGDKGKGGNGGAVTNFDVSCEDNRGTDTTDYLWVYGGDGGSGGAGGGNGGSSMNGKMHGGDGGTGFYIYGGDGGSGNTGDMTLKAKGGNGGNILNVTVDVGASNSETEFFSGDGGDGKNANGGNGGFVKNLKFLQAGTISGTFEISTGDGGDVAVGDGNGGNGGAMINSSFTHASGPGLGNSADVQFFTGDGGNGSGKGNGGSGGPMTNFKVNFQAEVDDLEIYTGEGGDAGGEGKLAGKGGPLSKLSLTAVGAVGFPATIYAGDGGNAAGTGAFGGDSGPINGITLAAPLADIRINQGTHGGEGGSGPGAKGGNGGAVSNVKGSVGYLSILGAEGGDSQGAGGNGGAVIGTSITTVTNFVQLIQGGDGGNGDTSAGNGGSVSKTKVAGDIGDFASAFAVQPSSGSMGGLIAGQGGRLMGTIDASKNGSILGVEAERIAAILAGAPFSNDLTADNAVAKITGLKGVTAIGADVGGDTNFTFVDNGMMDFNLGDGDDVTDGLIIVRAPFTAPGGVGILKLVTVSV